VLYTGSALQAAALMLQAYKITGRGPTSAGSACASSSGSPARARHGSVADRMDRKKIALFGIAGEVICSVALLLYALTTPTEVWPLFVIAFGYGVARAFLAPATRPMPAMVAPEGGLPRVIALYAATWTGATILGPAVSGLLYARHPSHSTACRR
jgi:nitrate/nitrite transporter NarK